MKYLYVNFLELCSIALCLSSSWHYIQGRIGCAIFAVLCAILSFLWAKNGSRKKSITLTINNPLDTTSWDVKDIIKTINELANKDIKSNINV